MKIKKHIQLLTITHPRYEEFVAENEFSMEEHLELLDKVVIEKAVEERVGAGRRHSKHVEEGESNHQGFCNIFDIHQTATPHCVVPTCIIKQVKQLSENTKDTERQPTKTKEEE